MTRRNWNNSPMRIPWSKNKILRQCSSMCGSEAILSISISKISSLDFCWACYLKADPTRQYKMYSRSNEGEAFAFSISSAVYMLPSP